MNWKKILLDPSFWMLLVVNVYMVYKYEQNPKVFNTLLWLYWSQSVFLGFFNFLDMRTSPKVDVSIFKPTENGGKSDKKVANSLAWFFLLHFGGFHFCYFVFLGIKATSGFFDWIFYKQYLLVFLILQVVNFVQRKIHNKDRAVNIGKMFYMPYLRIIPMHLCILIPAFFNFSDLSVFLVFKSIADVAMFILTTNYYQKVDPVTTQTAINTNSILSSE